MYYAPEHPIDDPYFGKDSYGSVGTREARIYHPDELPFWLAIGPIEWEAKYSELQHYMYYESENGYSGYVNVGLF